MSEYYEGFLPNAVEVLANLARGHLKPPEFKRMSLPDWDVGRNELALLSNAKIIDVDLGRVREEEGILLKGGTIEELIKPSDLGAVREKYPLKKEVDCRGRFLMPGLSDIHCHIANTTEAISSLGDIAYFPAQREKNCEVAIKNGTTFLRDAGGARGPRLYLSGEIESMRLVGPNFITPLVPVVPKGGMWDFGVLKNALAAAFLFGGKHLNFIKSDRELLEKLDQNLEKGAQFVKTYEEEKPLYGFEEDTLFTMWTPEQLRIIRDFADRQGQMLACHAMFIKGARMAIDACVDSVEHMTVDSEYTFEDAKKMVQNDVGIVPTLSAGMFLAFELGEKGYYHGSDIKYFKEYRDKVVPGHIHEAVIPELLEGYLDFFKHINEGFENDRMPGAGPIWPERVTGFAHFVRKSFESFREAGVKVGIGTDGGIGISFPGLLESELHLSHYLGYSIPEVLRMATLGNMEICGLEKERGSIEPGKKGDILVLGSNPLEDLENMKSLEEVFKDGRLYFSKEQAL